MIWLPEFIKFCTTFITHAVLSWSRSLFISNPDSLIHTLYTRSSCRGLKILYFTLPANVVLSSCHRAHHGQCFRFLPRMWASYTGKSSWPEHHCVIQSLAARVLLIMERSFGTVQPRSFHRNRSLLPCLVSFVRRSFRNIFCSVNDSRLTTMQAIEAPSKTHKHGY